MSRALRTLVTACVATLAVVATSLALPGSAGAAATRPWGRITSTTQHRDGTVTVTGYAYDRSSVRRSTTGCIAVAGTCERKVVANRASRSFDKAHHISGAHAFSVLVHRLPVGVVVQLRTYPGRSTLLDTATVASVGARIVNLAKRYVGHARYVEGGSTPKGGFDCSGYTQWVYSHSNVSALPHNAEAQRHVAHMHKISRAAARPGDLVFYFDGGAAYHVAIYAGHGKQYAAATPRDGIRYQAIWSSNVEFRTDWH